MPTPIAATVARTAKRDERFIRFIDCGLQAGSKQITSLVAALVISRLQIVGYISVRI